MNLLHNSNVRKHSWCSPSKFNDCFKPKNLGPCDKPLVTLTPGVECDPWGLEEQRWVWGWGAWLPGSHRCPWGRILTAHPHCRPTSCQWPILAFCLSGTLDPIPSPLCPHIPGDRGVSWEAGGPSSSSYQILSLGSSDDNGKHQLPSVTQF